MEEFGVAMTIEGKVGMRWLEVAGGLGRYARASLPRRFHGLVTTELGDVWDNWCATECLVLRFKSEQRLFMVGKRWSLPTYAV